MSASGRDGAQVQVRMPVSAWAEAAQRLRGSGQDALVRRICEGVLTQAAAEEPVTIEMPAHEAALLGDFREKANP